MSAAVQPHVGVVSGLADIADGTSAPLHWINSCFERIAQRVGAPIAGFYTYGEFARTQGASGFHNQTLVTLAIG